MPQNLRIFIGSSTEAKPIAQVIQDVLFDECDASVLGWWNDDAFPVGKTFIESIMDNVSVTNASIILATPDDRITSRGTHSFVARDNIIFEHGIFAGAHGRDRATLATLGDPVLPTDLLGVAVLRLRPAPRFSDFKERNRLPLRTWATHVAKAKGSKDSSLPDTHDPQIPIANGRLTYADVEVGIDLLTEDARQFVPNFIVGINRGGAIVGGCIAKRLGIPEVSLLSVGRGSLDVIEHRRHASPLSGRVLLVDDAIRNGEHMRESSSYLRQRYPSVTLHCSVLLRLAVPQAIVVDKAAFLTTSASVVLPWDPQ